MTTQQNHEALAAQQFSEARPAIIGALKLKLRMIQREQETARIYGKDDLGNIEHLCYLSAESIATQQLIKKLEGGN